MFEKVMLWIYRASLGIAFLLLFVGILERILLFLKYQLMIVPLGPAKLLQLAVFFCIFAMALLLRQIRDELKKGHAKV